MRAPLITLACCITATAFAGTAREDFEQAKEAYRNKRDCNVAQPLLNFVLHPKEKLADRESLFEAHVMLGACFADAGDPASAKDEFEAALQLKPREVLDSQFFSARAVRIFDDTRADVENRAKKDAELRELQAQRERVELALKNLRVYRQNYYILNFAPFGVGQYQNGDKLKAALFAGGQIAALGGSVGIWYYLVNKYGIRSTKVPLDEGPGVRRLQQVEIGAGLAFYGLWIWSAIDALRHYEPQRRVAGDEDLLNEIKKEATDKKKPKSSFLQKLHLTPMASQTGVGIGIGWEN